MAYNHRETNNMILKSAQVEKEGLLTKSKTKCAHKRLVANDNRHRRNHRQTQRPDGPQLKLLALTHLDPTLIDPSNSQSTHHKTHSPLITPYLNNKNTRKTVNHRNRGNPNLIPPRINEPDPLQK